jgi:hypothetical protein
MVRARGRKAAEAVSMAAIARLETIARPDAPYDLTDEQADEWRAMVGRMPADWFPRETWGMLSQYCRHVVSARRVAQLIDLVMKAKKKDFDVEGYDQLLRMQEREGRAMSSLATRMRLSQQATYDKTKKKNVVVSGRRPWDPD